jgi:hypothetical protein
MSFAETMEHLDRRQAVYEERVAEFDELVERRQTLFDRTRSLSELCDSANQSGILLGTTEAGNATTAYIYAGLGYRHDEAGQPKKIDRNTKAGSGVAIQIVNAAASKGVSLPWNHFVTGTAEFHAKKGGIRTPLGLAHRALVRRSLDRRLDTFGDAIDLLEMAALNPALNPALAELSQQS